MQTVSRDFFYACVIEESHQCSHLRKKHKEHPNPQLAQFRSNPQCSGLHTAHTTNNAIVQGKSSPRNTRAAQFGQQICCNSKLTASLPELEKWQNLCLWSQPTMQWAESVNLYTSTTWYYLCHCPLLVFSRRGAPAVNLIKQDQSAISAALSCCHVEALCTHDDASHQSSNKSIPLIITHHTPHTTPTFLLVEGNSYSYHTSTFNRS